MLQLEIEIGYRIKKSHPDYPCMPHKAKGKRLKYKDIYTFRYLDEEDEEEAITYAKHDMALIAGGGYSTAHLYNVGYTYRFI